MHKKKNGIKIIAFKKVTNLTKTKMPLVFCSK